MNWKNYDYLPIDRKPCVEAGHDQGLDRCLVCDTSDPPYRKDENGNLFRVLPNRSSVVTIRATSATDALWRLENRRNLDPENWFRYGAPY